MIKKNEQHRRNRTVWEIDEKSSPSLTTGEMYKSKQWGNISEELSK